MNLYDIRIEDEVPDEWDFIIKNFLDCTEYFTRVNKVPTLSNIRCYVRHGLLHIDYIGGDESIDAFAYSAQRMSEKICGSCGAEASRLIFEAPRCNDCI